MKHTDPQMHLRFPQDVKDWIDAEAVKNERSKSAQVVFGLRLAMRATVETEKASGQLAGTPDASLSNE